MFKFKYINNQFSFFTFTFDETITEAGEIQHKRTF